MHKRISIQSKIMVSIITIALIAVSVIGYYGYSEARDVYTLKIQKSEHNSVEDMVRSIDDKISVMKQDANFIANFYAMQKLLNWQSVGVKSKINKWDLATKATFSSLINLKNFYYKLRIIGLDGMEQINVFYDQQKQHTATQENHKMQDRSKERYFYEATDLKAGEVYVSQMELNMEFGKIVRPYVPIVHFSSVIYDKSGQKRGVAVINAYAKIITDVLQVHDDVEDKKHYMIDNKGYYLYNKESKKLWGEQLPHGANFQKDYPKLYHHIQTHERGQYETKERLFTFYKIYPDVKEKKEYWVVISQVKKDTIFAPLNEFKMIFALILMGTLLILFYVIRFFISSFLDPLGVVTDQMTLLSKGEVRVQSIAYRGNDEIKDLIVASIRLIANTKATITQAKSVAQGDFTQRLTPNSTQDSLAIAINEMSNRLEESSQIAQKLSCGNIDTHIAVNSDRDTLAHALNALIDYFEKITAIAESISKGNYNIGFKPASDTDRLGVALDEMIKRLREIFNQANAIADGDYSTTIKPKSSEDRLGLALQKMTQGLYESKVKNEQDSWLKDGLNDLAKSLSGVESLKLLGDRTIWGMSKHVSGASGVLYLYDAEQEELYLQSSYAYTDREALSLRFKKGEGVIGQVALEGNPILLKNIPKHQFTIESGIVNQEPLNSYSVPIVYEGNLIGVAEVASFEHFNDKSKEFLNKAALVSSAYFYNVMQNAQIKELLEDSQRAYEELQVKSEELQQSNVQMEEQQQQLEQQAQDLKMKNRQLETTKKELDVRADELERSSQYKSEFLANMSHELRTPLNSIILLSKMLGEESQSRLNADDIKKARVIHQSGQDLLLLINDILDLSKIESGKMELSHDELSTQDIITQVDDLFRPIAMEKGVELILKDHCNALITVDRIKLMQIVKNLLSNAFKFTQKGHVEFSIRVDSSQDLPFIIEVSDTGIGIAQDKREMIFDAFKQVDGSISRTYGGTGLGLSISKKFTELMGGEIRLSSTKGSGSTFGIYLPQSHLANAVQKPTNAISKQESPKRSAESTQLMQELILDSNQQNSDDEMGLRNKTILITDDDSRNIFSLSALLQHAGAQTLHALNGKEALEVLKNKRVDLVLMDIMMPQMDGYATIKAIRKEEAFVSLPIIAVTAKAMKEDRAKCIDAGANDYIAKPIEQDALLMMIKAWLSKQ
jgi:signal transduction histidine kinase/ActR/RegA family two-component response regulator